MHSLDQTKEMLPSINLHNLACLAETKKNAKSFSEIERANKALEIIPNLYGPFIKHLVTTPAFASQQDMEMKDMATMLESLVEYRRAHAHYCEFNEGKLTLCICDLAHAIDALSKIMK